MEYRNGLGLSDENNCLHNRTTCDRPRQEVLRLAQEASEKNHVGTSRSMSPPSLCKFQCNMQHPIAQTEKLGYRFRALRNFIQVELPVKRSNDQRPKLRFDRKLCSTADNSLLCRCMPDISSDFLKCLDTISVKQFIIGNF